MKIAYCLDHDSNQLLFNYPSHNVILFLDKQGKRFVVFVPKNPYNVSYDIEFDMIRLRLSKQPFHFFCWYHYLTFLR